MYKNLISKIKKKKVVVAIIGLGYVGLPLAIRFLDKNIRVLGIDKDLNKIKSIKNGISYIQNKSFKNNKLYFDFQKNCTSKYSVISDADAIIVCLPTPLDRNKNPDLSILKTCAINISTFLKKGQIFILESTVYPGATIEVFKILNKENKFCLGKDFYLSFSPERENPGDISFSYKSTPKVISGYSVKCSQISFNLYKLIAKKVFLAKSILVAELSKLLENSYRSVNIGLVNEFKIISDRLGVNIWDVIEAAKTKNFGFRPFNPGPGVGGHCIPIDPTYLTWYMKKKKYVPKVIKNSTKINSSMPIWVSKKIIEFIKRNKIIINKILIVGLAYKKNVADTRESPSVDIMKIFVKKKYHVQFYDPIVKRYEYENKYFQKESIHLNTIRKLKKNGLVIITTDHKGINYNKILSDAKLIFDTRGVYKYYKSNKVLFI